MTARSFMDRRWNRPRRRGAGEVPFGCAIVRDGQIIAQAGYAL